MIDSSPKDCPEGESQESLSKNKLMLGPGPIGPKFVQVDPQKQPNSTAN